MTHYTKHTHTALTISCLALLSATARAQPVKIEGSAKLASEAKIKPDSAIAVARREVPNGRIESAELEREQGRLLYSFDIKVAGRPGTEEVQVDALTGAMIAHEHETPKMEQAEAAAEAKAKAAKTRKP